VEQFPNGERFEGQYRRDKMHGWGTHYFPDGRVVSGTWQGDQKHGEFTITWQNSQQRAKEVWNNGTLLQGAG
jgi:antitoxin component YwqK of YwqJK toxin-antitoxin module